MTNYKYHKDGTEPNNGEIFVFGSNLAGRHGAGAAKLALQKYGALYGVGYGRMDQSYGIPTKDENLNTLDLTTIKLHVYSFLWLAFTRPDLQFWMTSVGCGLAGWTPAHIAPMFRCAPDNINFPDTWKEYLEKENNALRNRQM